MKYLVLFAMISLAPHFTNAQDGPKGLPLNSTAPGFIAKDQNGKSVSLAELLKKGPVVLVFYRGQWCPYCNKQLQQLQDSLQYISAKGTTVIAVTPEQPANVNKTIGKTKASFSILTDEGLTIMKSYDVSFAVDTKTIEKYKNYGIDFNLANGTNGANLPVPAVYIIDKAGKIIYRYFDTNYSKRASVADILEHL